MQYSDPAALHNAREIQRNKLKEYKKRFFGESSFNPHLHESATCPTCHSSPENIIIKKGFGEYAHCPQCDHIYLSNPLTDEATLEFYKNYPSNTLEWHTTETDFYDRIYSKGLDAIRPFAAGKTILDIGCSSGLFLSIASSRGYECFGIEPNKLESAYAKDHGINVCGAQLSDLDICERFDIITLWDVLEHIKNPKDYLGTLKNHLRSSDSLVFVQIPSADSLAARMLREHCKMFDGLEHLTLFSYRSLKETFEQAGYELLCAHSVISELYPIVNYLSYCHDPYLQKPTNPYPIDSLGLGSLEKDMLGYKIQAVFRSR